MENQWILYGATGFTGQLIAAEAKRRGLQPTLAGRNKEKLDALGQKLDLPWLVLDLSDRAGLIKALEPFDLILNAAGPFVQTAGPLVEAALESGTSYLDVANEIEVFQKIYALDAQARQKKIALVPGVGFGTVATNLVAKQVAEQLPDATELEIASIADNITASAGASKTVLDVIAGGGKIYQDSELKSYRLGRGVQSLSFPGQTSRLLVPAPLGDLLSAQRSTNIPNVKAYIEAPAKGLTFLVMPVLQTALKVGSVRRLMEKQAEKPAKSQATQRTSYHSYGWARARNGQGKMAEAWVKIGEGYGFTAISSVWAVEQVLKLKPVGSLTPAQLDPDGEFRRRLLVGEFSGAA